VTKNSSHNPELLAVVLTGKYRVETDWVEDGYGIASNEKSVLLIDLKLLQLDATPSLGVGPSCMSAGFGVLAAWHAAIIAGTEHSLLKLYMWDWAIHQARRISMNMDFDTLSPAPRKTQMLTGHSAFAFFPSTSCHGLYVFSDGGAFPAKSAFNPTSSPIIRPMPTRATTPIPMTHFFHFDQKCLISGERLRLTIPSPAIAIPLPLPRLRFFPPVDEEEAGEEDSHNLDEEVLGSIWIVVEGEAAFRLGREEEDARNVVEIRVAP
jgi:hypothetical protein